MTAWLLTWVWQGLALALGVAIALRCVRRPNAATRHLVWFGSLGGACMARLDGITLRRARPRCRRRLQTRSISRLRPTFFISSVIGIWAAVALVSLLRLLPSLHALYAMRDRCYPFPQAIEATLPLWLEAKESGRRTELMMCDAVPGATVLGLQRPCIAIPSSLAEALTAEELDQVILHEHAHVQRRDDWSRLVQTLLMSVLWIHPAALLVSRALEPRARDGVRRMGRGTHRFAEGVRQVSHASGRGAGRLQGQLGVDTHAVQRAARSRAASGPSVDDKGQDTTARVICQSSRGDVRDGADLGATPGREVCGARRDRAADTWPDRSLPGTRRRWPWGRFRSSSG